MCIPTDILTENPSIIQHPVRYELALRRKRTLAQISHTDVFRKKCPIVRGGGKSRIYCFIALLSNYGAEIGRN